MEPKELLSKLAEIDMSPETYHYEDYNKSVFESVGLETPVEIDQWGGEGQGEDYGFVIHFPTLDIYLRADGSYASYDGSDLSDSTWKVVTKQEKTITVYE